MNRNNQNHQDKFHLTELILVAADIYRTFPATMLTKLDDNDQEYYVGAVIINEGEVIGRAKTQAELERNMDDICKMKLDYRLHGTSGISSEILLTKFIHN